MRWSTEMDNELKKLLQDAVDNGIIDLSDVQRQIMERERKNVLEKHIYKIWQGENGKWYTYLPDSTKKNNRKLIKRNDKKSLEDVIVDFYKEDKHTGPKNFKELFDMYVNFQRKEAGVSDNTYSRYCYDYNRFFAGTEFESMRLSQINSEVVRAFITNRTKELSLRKKSMDSMYGLIKSSFHYGMMYEYVDNNPVFILPKKMFSKYCYTPAKIPGRRTVSDAQMSALNDILQKDFVTKPEYIPSYAVKLATMTGLRSGELAALKWSDIHGNMLVVDESEKYNRVKKQYVIEKTKNNEDRIVPLSKESIQLLERVRKIKKIFGFDNSEFIFSNEKGKVNVRTISDCARNKSIQAGIDAKSIHAIRRTVNSNLRKNGMSAAMAASIMGHSPEVNERSYTYDIADFEEKLDCMEVINSKTASL